MSKPTYAEQISNAQLMVAGLRAHATELTRRGLDETFTNKLETDRLASANLNNEQEKLKADLKTKTVALDTKLVEMEKAMAEAKKIVKLDFPVEQWKEFGILDKR